MLLKNVFYKKIGCVLLFFVLFGINELILFGVLIILNLIMFILYVFGGVIIGILLMFFMYWGWLVKLVFDFLYVGVFLEGFLINGDWYFILVNVL